MNVFFSDMMVTSITQDESMMYWTNGSVIASVDVAESSTPNVWIPFEDCKIISIRTLSPGQQPQYCKKKHQVLPPFWYHMHLTIFI